MARPIRSAFPALAAFLLIAASVGAMGESHVRIVRLSLVEGQVQVDRAVGGGLERAILNTPMVQGTRIVTGSDGLAEVEFENQSALRIASDSEVRFTQLSMGDTGVKTNQVEVVKGLVYLETASKGDDTYRMTSGKSSLLVHRDSGVRFSASADQLQVAVFKGDAQLENTAQPVNVQKKETLTVDLKQDSSYTIAKSVEPVRYDGWNKEREEYGKAYAANEGYGGPSHGYGMQDLNYYGDFFYASGYGYVWQPYGFAGAMSSFDPYSNGAWAALPGLGYSFTSAYPWGWLPYHYGSWAFVQGAGWAWLPGGGYNGQWYAGNYQNVPKVTKAPAGWKAPVAPAVLEGNRVPPTVYLGKALSGPLTIPGGRVPPNFASVVPGRTVATTATAHGYVKPSAGSMQANRTVFASAHEGMAAHAVPTGHVFATPPVRGLGVADDAFAGRAYGRSGGATPMAVPSHSSVTSAPATAGHK